MITVRVVGDDRIIQRLKSLSPEVRRQLQRSVTRLGLLMATDVKVHRLHKDRGSPPIQGGQVLSVRTGRLTRSVHQGMVSTSNEVIGKVGTNVEYAAYHEYGFSGSVSVAAHVRHLKDGRIQNVGAHTRNVNYPARSFLRAALKSFAPQIREELHAAVSLAISKTMG